MCVTSGRSCPGCYPAGGGTITIGSVPSEERPAAWQEKAVWWVMSICLWQHNSQVMQCVSACVPTMMICPFSPQYDTLLGLASLLRPMLS